MRVNNIVIVGGGTAGWMTASTFVRLFPDKKITLIESPNIKSIGVGESTIAQFRKWLALVKIKDYDFMKECDASYKFTIRFTNFHKKTDSRVDYPFGYPNNIISHVAPFSSNLDFASNSSSILNPSFFILPFFSIPIWVKA